MNKIFPAALTGLLVILQGCRNLDLPPPPTKVKEVLAACPSSTVSEYFATHPDANSVDDIAALTCKLDGKLDSTSSLASTAASVCAHALGAYAPPLPRSVGAIQSDTTGQQTCVQSQKQCGYALFIKQIDGRATNLELLGPAGCGRAPDLNRGVLFACCEVPSPPPGSTFPTPTDPPTTTVPH